MLCCCAAALMLFREIATLADLEAYLCCSLKVEAFNELQMGPLLRHPLIIANIKPPATVVEVPQVRLDKMPQPHGSCSGTLCEQQLQMTLQIRQ
jgi:hypothetical protein